MVCERVDGERGRGRRRGWSVNMEERKEQMRGDWEEMED